MAVGTPKWAQGYTASAAESAVAWPAGAAVGELALLVCRDGRDGRNGPKVAGWTQGGRRLWTKVIEAADLAAPVQAWGRTFFLATIPGAAGVGYPTERASGYCQAGGGLFVQGWQRDSSTIAPAANRLGVQWIDFTGEATAVWWMGGATGGTVRLPGTDDDATYWGYPIVPRFGPSAPTLSAPSSGANVDVAKDVPLSWLHQPQVAGGVQESRKVRVKASSTSTWSHLRADGTLTAAEQPVATAATTASIAPGLTAGQSYDWAVSTMEAGVWSAWSASSSFTVRVAPVVSAVSIVIAVQSMRCAVAWTVTAGYGSQESRRVQIVDGAGVVVYDSGWASTGAPSLTTPPIDGLVTGQPYRAVVEAMQTGGLSSQAVLSNGAAVPSLTPPAAPTGVTAVDGRPLVVTVSGIPTGAGLQVARLDGGAWEMVTERPLAQSTECVPQPLTPYGRPVQFRARTWALVDGVRVYSAWTLSTPVTGHDEGSYFVADDGLTYLAVGVTECGTVSPVQGYAEYVGAGSAMVRVDRTPVAGRIVSGVMLWAETAAEMAALADWLTTSPPWVFRWPPESGLDVPPQRVVTRRPPSWQHVVESAMADRDITVDLVEQ